MSWRRDMTCTLCLPPFQKVWAILHICDMNFVSFLLSMCEAKHFFEIVHSFMINFVHFQILVVNEILRALMKKELVSLKIGLYHPLDGITYLKYKMLYFVTTKNNFCEEKKALAFNQDRCCHLALCLRLILSH